MTEPVLKPSYGKEQADLLALFDRYLMSAGKAGKTRKLYVDAVRRWAGSVDSLDPPSRPLLQAHFAARRRQVSQATLNVEAAAIRAFCTYLALCGRLSDPGPLLEVIPVSKRPPARLVRALDEWQIGRLLAAPDLSAPLGFRDHVMLRLVYETGITALEAVRLHLGDIMTEHRMIHVDMPARRTERFLPYSRALHGLLDDWIRLRRQFRPGKRSVLFVTRDGRPFSSGRGVWDIVNRYARDALGLARGFDTLASIHRRRPWGGHYPHLLRASFAQHLLRNGCNLRAVQELLGHADVKTTARYVGVDLELLRREHRKLFP